MLGVLHNNQLLHCGVWVQAGVQACVCGGAGICAGVQACVRGCRRVCGGAGVCAGVQVCAHIYVIKMLLLGDHYTDTSCDHATPRYRYIM